VAVWQTEGVLLVYFDFKTGEIISSLYTDGNDPVENLTYAFGILLRI
jgi:hypothetical protein